MRTSKRRASVERERTRKPFEVEVNPGDAHGNDRWIPWGEHETLGSALADIGARLDTGVTDERIGPYRVWEKGPGDQRMLVAVVAACHEWISSHEKTSRPLPGEEAPGEEGYEEGCEEGEGVRAEEEEAKG